MPVTFIPIVPPPSLTSVIRIADTQDRAGALAMARHFIAETDYKDTLGDHPDALGATIDGLIARTSGVLFVSERDGELSGMCAVVVYAHPFTGERWATELVWWVEPFARTTRAGLKLLRAAEAFAREQGATTMQLGSWHGRLNAFYERLGYHETETIFQRRLTQETP